MLGKIKYYLVGLLSGLILAGGISYADEMQYKLTKLDCLVWVDGVIASMDTPVLNYEGRSYVPLRKSAELTGALVDWDANRKIINISTNPKVTEKIVTKEVIKEVPKEVIKEVIKEIPKEVIKEVVKEVIPKDTIIVRKIDGLYFFVDEDSNKTGLSFGIDINKGRGACIFYTNGIQVNSKDYYEKTNTTVQQNKYTQTPIDNSVLYNAEYNKLKNNYDSSVKEITDKYQAMKNDAAARSDIALMNQKKATGNNSDTSLVLEGNARNSLNGQLTQIDNAQKDELTKLENNFNSDISILKAKYGIN